LTKGRENNPITSIESDQSFLRLGGLLYNPYWI
jgi:hypothetical protein